jgi:4-amino-4-deoxy-L-arabinose transferase-like glycosyltransferase
MGTSLKSADRKIRVRLWGWLGVLLVCRLLLLIAAPQTDPSEARYAEISRKMVETKDWITPQFDYGVPFWAKPPLSMWMSAAGMELFGVNEFGSRIFIFIASLAVLWLVARAARDESGVNTGLTAAVILMAMPLFFLCSAAVMTDLALVLGTTWAMVAFRLAVRDGSRTWGYGFFLALAVGLLAKGPLALVIVGVPLGGWVLLTGQWKRTWQSLPWISGAVLMLLISVPWYGLAEQKTPGFARYFFIGEHWERFMVKGWQGDLYGGAHAAPRGMVWLFWVVGSFPWCLALFSLPLRRWRELRSWAMSDQGHGLYLLLWIAWPLVFFTTARNVILAYPLPCLPAMALLIAGVLNKRSESWFRPLGPLCLALSGGFVAYSLAVGIFLPDYSPKRSERELIRLFLKERTAQDRLIYYGARRLSAEFYMQGPVEHTTSVSELQSQLDGPGRLYVEVDRRYLHLLPAEIRQRLVPVKLWKESGLYVESD